MRRLTFLPGLLLIVLFAGTISLAATTSGPLLLTSPDGGVQIIFRLAANQTPEYSVTFHGQPVVEHSSLSLEFRQGGPWVPGQEITDVRRDAHDETYSLVAGKSSTARDHYKQMIVALRDTAAPHRKIELHFRAYDDGAAFRYLIRRRNRSANLKSCQSAQSFAFPPTTPVGPRNTGVSPLPRKKSLTASLLTAS